MGVLKAILVFLRAFILSRAAAAFENLALRQQVAVLNQSVKRPRLRPRDRIFWVVLSPWGQKTETTSKPTESTDFTLAHSMNLRRRSEASMRIDAAATQPVFWVLCYQVMPSPKHPK